MKRKCIFTGCSTSILGFNSVYEKIQNICVKNGSFDYWIIRTQLKSDPWSNYDLDQLNVKNIIWIDEILDSEEISLHPKIETFSKLNMKTFEDGLSFLLIESNDDAKNCPVQPDILISLKDFDTIQDYLNEIFPQYLIGFSKHDFKEMVPYESRAQASESVYYTRPIILADSQNDRNAKWIYAVNIMPIAHEGSTPKPSSFIESPYQKKKSNSKRPSPDSDETGPNFFFQVSEAAPESSLTLGNSDKKKPKTGYICKRCHSDQHFFKDCPHQENQGDRPKYVCHICHEPGHKIQNCPKKSAKGTIDKSSPESCWFCLANPAIRKHLIIDIGEEVYYTLAKGGIIPEHFIIVPIEHQSSTRGMSESIFNEIKQIALKLRQIDQSDFLVFAHRQNPQHHLHLQAISIPNDKISEFPEFLKSFAMSKTFEIMTSSESSLMSDSRCFECFLTSEPETTYKICLNNDQFFPASFGRELAATFLNLSDRVDWRLSPLTEDEEKDLVQKFKSKLN